MTDQALTSASSPGSGDSTSPSTEPVSDAPDRSSGTSTAGQSSLDTGPTFPDGEMSPGSPLLHTPTSDASMRENRYAQGGANLGHDLTALSAASPASRSPQRDDAKPKTTIAGCGLSSPAAYASLNLDGSWSRTYRDFSVQESLAGLPSEGFSETWPRSGSMSAGRVFEHPMSVPPTAESVSSSLPTPRTWDAEYRGKGSTPQEAAGMTGRPLSSAVLDLLPTPTTQDGENTGGPSQSRRHTPPLNSLLSTPSAWLGRREAHSKGDPERFTNPERSNDLSDHVAWIASLGDPTNPPSEGGSE